MTLSVPGTNKWPNLFFLAHSLTKIGHLFLPRIACDFQAARGFYIHLTYLKGIDIELLREPCRPCHPFLVLIMPFLNEKSPSRRHQIVFKPLEDLIYDAGYSIFSYPSLEQPRQLSLGEHEFDTINRDYCIVQSPGETSWQQSESQENPVLKIFHADSVKVPKWKALEKFQPSGYIVGKYNTRWYLQGMTRVNVEKLLKRHFKLVIPLSKESSPAHWIPCPVLYSVEVGEDVWENRLALFFDGNVETSVQSMVNRISKYGQAMQSGKFGEYYLNIWRSKWEKKDDSLEPQEFAHSKEASLVEGIGEVQSTEENTPTTNQKPRGRKKRATLRKLRSESSTLVRVLLPHFKIITAYRTLT